MNEENDANAIEDDANAMIEDDANAIEAVTTIIEQVIASGKILRPKAIEVLESVGIPAGKIAQRIERQRVETRHRIETQHKSALASLPPGARAHVAEKLAQAMLNQPEKLAQTMLNRRRNEGHTSGPENESLANGEKLCDNG